MAIWIKPNGNKIETNNRDVTTDYMASIGCKLEETEKPKKKVTKKAK